VVLWRKLAQDPASAFPDRVGDVVVPVPRLRLHGDEQFAGPDATGVIAERRDVSGVAGPIRRPPVAINRSSR
jgi:hypothetical protein